MFGGRLNFTQKFSSRSPRAPQLEVNVNALRNEDLLVQEVRRILSHGFEEARRIIGKTSITAYRRVHEVVASALDRLASAGKRDKSLLVDLSKALILVRYQYARDQISEGIARYVEDVVKGVLDEAGKDWENARKVARNARTLLDALAVLVYEYT